LSANPETNPDTEEEEELSPRAARVMRIVLWSVVAVMAAGWIFLFYNVLSRSLAPPAPPPPPVAAKPAPAPPAKPAAAPPVAAAAKPAAHGPSREVLSDVRIQLDTPNNGETVNQPFPVIGWAADLAATDGTGIGAVHVHIYPCVSCPAAYVGTAEYGAERPDVAAAIKPNLPLSGYSLVVAGLPPGEYRLYVFATSTLTNSLAPKATSATITVR
jgi:hypothetical protein